jgi:hypothetical protein
MKKNLAQSLRKEAERTAISYSDPGREFNQNAESFSVYEIIPLSEFVAGVIMEKNTGKRAVFVFYYTRQSGGTWRHFVPTDSHILGLEKISDLKREVEMYNYYQNFDPKDQPDTARVLLADRRVALLLSLLGLGPVETPGGSEPGVEVIPAQYQSTTNGQ